MLRRTGVGRAWASANSPNRSTATATAPGSAPKVIWKPGPISPSRRSLGDATAPTGQGPCQGATYPPGFRPVPPLQDPPGPVFQPLTLWVVLGRDHLDNR